MNQTRLQKKTKKKKTKEHIFRKSESKEPRRNIMEIP